MYYDGILTARQWRECCLRTVLVKWSPEARGHVPPPSSIAAGAARAAGAAGQVGTHPRVLREEKSSAFTMYSEDCISQRS